MTIETTKQPSDELKSRWPVKDRVNATAKLAYGYIPDPENQLKAIPNWEVVYLVEEALDYLDKRHSLRETAGWLS